MSFSQAAVLKTKYNPLNNRSLPHPRHTEGDHLGAANWEWTESQRSLVRSSKKIVDQVSSLKTKV